MAFTTLVLAFGSVLLLHSAVIPTSDDLQQRYYSSRIGTLYEILAEECPEYIQQKRDLTDQQSFNTLVTKVQQLEKALTKCQEKKRASWNTSAAPSTTPNLSPVPSECLTATNLSQSWRRDHSLGGLRPGGPHSASNYACDLYEELGWFRFTGAAGTHMLDTCPTFLSCGTFHSYWTDGKAPQTVGVAKKIPVYRVFGNQCKTYTRHVQVMRCSFNTPHDVIYKYIGDYVRGTSTCMEAFCGMI